MGEREGAQTIGTKIETHTHLRGTLVEIQIFLFRFAAANGCSSSSDELLDMLLHVLADSPSISRFILPPKPRSPTESSRGQSALCAPSSLRGPAATSRDRRLWSSRHARRSASVPSGAYLASSRDVLPRRPRGRMTTTSAATAAHGENFELRAAFRPFYANFSHKSDSPGPRARRFLRTYFVYRDRSYRAIRILNLPRPLRGYRRCPQKGAKGCTFWRSIFDGDGFDADVPRNGVFRARVVSVADFWSVSGEGRKGRAARMYFRRVAR